ncbi:MAG: HD-GYP domain-containing protein [Alphaproteobacteria bacterium]|jgi:putative nucleotidyltransferase with HDIG domain|nr:HD-GYP domain-containing protein [Alphaproteobacteria bacterium]MBU0804385.1 HD-GYP domain-containing protein [Alphaproteobacteria bacterium]MBU0871216.1 HD-GYP domain-containing protein [Alphaproteobacteria bacterium]MBU1400971.1 HD-GYP domain-containing protein [Alphaproteobacteria bacterium]MBU1592612.1 HD-GYP domain-containing protein [Alphaproteobacteria bacterium]
MTKSTLLEIDKSEACLGMFIHGFGKQWLSSPFALSQFKLTSPAELKALRESSVSTLTIDLSRGIGPKNGTPAKPKPHQNQGADNGAAAMKQATEMVRSLFGSASSSTGIDRQKVEAVVDVVDQLVFTRPTTILNLTKLKTKDEISFQHSIAVCALVGMFARHLKLEGKLVRILCVSGLLHDIGKLHIPTAILTKNGMLTAEEIAVMQTHPRKGYEILAKGTGLPDIVGKVCLQHHEKLDGSGYPAGLKDGEIVAAARMVAICDVFDALTSIRPYKKGSTPETAAAMMATWKGHFDQMLLNKFFDCMGLQSPERRMVANVSAQTAHAADEMLGLSQADLDGFQF